MLISRGERRIAFAFRARELFARSSIKITSSACQSSLPRGSNDDNEASSQRYASRNDRMWWLETRSESKKADCWARGDTERGRREETKRRNGENMQPPARDAINDEIISTNCEATRASAAASRPPALPHLLNTFCEPYDAKFFARSSTQAGIWIRAPKCIVLDCIHMYIYESFWKAWGKRASKR